MRLQQLQRAGTLQVQSAKPRSWLSSGSSCTYGKWFCRQSTVPKPQLFLSAQHKAMLEIQNRPSNKNPSDRYGTPLFKLPVRKTPKII